MTEISWRPFDDAAFAEARAQNKPVLLSVTASWCPFCHAMDEQTYRNEAIAQYINEHFVPVHVDSERRPEVNVRYAMGGLPSTCVLTPEGDVVWGGTTVPPDGMAQLLPQVLNSFHNDKQNLERHVTQQRDQLKQQAQGPALNPALSVTGEITRAAILGVKHNFDFAFGGFGREQKFAHPDALGLCLEQYAHSVRETGKPDEDMVLMLNRTLTALADGTLHDQTGNGGFFRYAQTPDWREPHHEKLLEDNALIARVFTQAYQVMGDERWRAVAERTLHYLDTTLYDAERGVWYGSQDADAEYYAQPPAERAEWNPPTVDETIFCGANAQAARAHVAWWQATGDEQSLARAKRAVDFLLAHHRADEDGAALLHFLSVSDDEEQAATGPVPAGLLGDMADMTAACLDLYEAGQGADYLDQAEALAEWARGHLEDPRSGGLFDIALRPDAIGNLKFPSKDLTDNMQMADALLRLYLGTGDEEHARLAQRILQAFLPALGQLGFFRGGLCPGRRARRIAARSGPCDRRVGRPAHRRAAPGGAPAVSFRALRSAARSQRRGRCVVSSRPWLSPGRRADCLCVRRDQVLGADKRSGRAERAGADRIVGRPATRRPRAPSKVKAPGPCCLREQQQWPGALPLLAVA
jgi:uncharacterized protein YyaL (SSP411 family)